MVVTETRRSVTTIQEGNKVGTTRRQQRCLWIIKDLVLCIQVLPTLEENVTTTRTMPPVVVVVVGAVGEIMAAEVAVVVMAKIIILIIIIIIMPVKGNAYLLIKDEKKSKTQITNDAVMAEASDISAAGTYHSELTASQGQAPFMTDVNSKKDQQSCTECCNVMPQKVSTPIPISMSETHRF